MSWSLNCSAPRFIFQVNLCWDQVKVNVGLHNLNLFSLKVFQANSSSRQFSWSDLMLMNDSVHLLKMWKLKKSFVLLRSDLMSLLSQVKSVASGFITAPPVQGRSNLKRWCWTAPLERVWSGPRSRWTAKASGNTALPSRPTTVERAPMESTARNPTSQEPRRVFNDDHSHFNFHNPAVSASCW